MVKQKVTSRRKILLILSLVTVAVSFLMTGGVVAIAMASGSAADNLAFSLSIALVVIAYLAMMGLAIAITVFCYIAYYDLFRSCRPNNAVLFLVLSVIFNVALAFFVFFSGNSDEGMPAKRQKDPAPRIPTELKVEEAEAASAEPETAEEEIPVVEAEIVEDPE